jgi:hypothetical protein
MEANARIPGMNGQRLIAAISPALRLDRGGGSVLIHGFVNKPRELGGMLACGRAFCAGLLALAMWLVSDIGRSAVPDAAMLAAIVGLAMGGPIVVLNALIWSFSAG